MREENCFAFPPETRTDSNTPQRKGVRGISLAKDKRFGSYFRKYQLISITNFGTAFGMGMLVLIFMVGQGFYELSFF